MSDYTDGYTCKVCGCPISAVEGDDNGGMCDDCAAPNERDYSEDRRKDTLGIE